ncbi:E3 ubiquitin-protein ligase [Melia azedarach]|uniref:E3 ubiquitin-protein ligase n=1 Tax=Melia azedarach TaxID=155640 RepID=A0ACC1X709_MELAZ|nr:E3 ubiquitin-protein ligase [Melia azedarach]
MKRTVKNLKKVKIKRTMKYLQEDEDEAEEESRADNGSKRKRSELVESPQRKGRISMTLGDREVLDCPICFEVLTIPVLQILAASCSLLSQNSKKGSSKPAGELTANSCNQTAQQQQYRQQTAATKQHNSSKISVEPPALLTANSSSKGVAKASSKDVAESKNRNNRAKAVASRAASTSSREVSDLRWQIDNFI